MQRTMRPSGLPRARESIFNQADASRAAYPENSIATSPYLMDCVRALEECARETRIAEEHLTQGTADLGRITKVLQNNKVFHLVSEGTIRQCVSEITEEIEPEINELIARAEKGLQALLKQETLLRAKLDAQAQGKSKGKGAAAAAMQSKMEKVDSRRLKMQVRQRERLEAELRELEEECERLEQDTARL